MSTTLTLQQLNQPLIEIEIGNTVSIGRHKSNDIFLDNDLRASRQHAVIRCQDGARYQIIDLGSRNGTFVNGRQVVLPVELTEGSKITIGTSTLVFHLPTISGSDLHGGSTVSDAGENLEDMTIQDSKQDVFDAAILVCDVRGFSTCSEQLPPNEVAHFIGHWFYLLGNIVDKHEGKIDKFIGDAILAYWRGSAEAVCAASYAAGCAMEQEAAKITWPVLGHPMRTAVALHHGTVSSGNIGTVAQRDATIMGDAVNTAFRLEAAMKPLGVSMLCSESHFSRIAPQEGFKDLGAIELKGKTRLVKVFGRA